MNRLEKLCFVHGLYDEKFLHPTPMDPRDQARRAKHCGAIRSRRAGSPHPIKQHKRGIFDNRQFLAY